MAVNRSSYGFTREFGIGPHRVVLPPADGPTGSLRRAMPEGAEREKKRVSIREAEPDPKATWRGRFRDFFSRRHKRRRSAEVRGSRDERPVAMARSRSWGPDDAQRAERGAREAKTGSTASENILLEQEEENRYGPSELVRLTLQPKGSVLGIEVHQVTLRRRAQGFGLHLSAGLPPISVTFVTPGGEAEMAGVRVGDMLVEVNGQDCLDASNITRLMALKMLIQRVEEGDEMPSLVPQPTESSLDDKAWQKIKAFQMQESHTPQDSPELEVTCIEEVSEDDSKDVAAAVDSAPPPERESVGGSLGREGNRKKRRRRKRRSQRVQADRDEVDDGLHGTGSWPRGEEEEEVEVEGLAKNKERKTNGYVQQEDENGGIGEGREEAEERRVALEEEAEERVALEESADEERAPFLREKSYEENSASVVDGVAPDPGADLAGVPWSAPSLGLRVGQDRRDLQGRRLSKRRPASQDLALLRGAGDLEKMSMDAITLGRRMTAPSKSSRSAPVPRPHTGSPPASHRRHTMDPGAVKPLARWLFPAPPPGEEEESEFRATETERVADRLARLRGTVQQPMPFSFGGSCHQPRPIRGSQAQAKPHPPGGSAQEQREPEWVAIAKKRQGRSATVTTSSPPESSRMEETKPHPLITERDEPKPHPPPANKAPQPRPPTGEDPKSRPLSTDNPMAKPRPLSTVKPEPKVQPTPKTEQKPQSPSVDYQQLKPRPPISPERQLPDWVTIAQAKQKKSVEVVAGTSRNSPQHSTPLHAASLPKAFHTLTPAPSPLHSSPPPPSSSKPLHSSSPLKPALSPPPPSISPSATPPLPSSSLRKQRDSDVSIPKQGHVAARLAMFSKGK